MKRISTLILLAAGLLTFASCDKIDEGHYTTFAGAAGTWYDTDAVIPHVQRAFIEKYTGVRCINCPKADEVIHAASDKYGDSVVVVAVHSRSTGFGRPIKDDPSLCTESGDEWYDYFGIAWQPAAMLNRSQVDNAWDIFNPTSNFDDRIDAIVNKQPPIAIAIQSNRQDGNTFYSEISMEFLENFNAPLTITLLLTQDNIHTHQSSQGIGEIEDYEQNHVLRTLVTNLWGFDVPTDIKQGDKRMIRFNYPLPADANPADYHAVAFVSYKDSRQIINSAQSNLQ